MAQGLQVWDSLGNLIVDTTSRTGKVLGIADITANVDGSVTNADFALGLPYWKLLALVNYSTFSPDITFSGTTLSWAWGGKSGPNHKILYGVY